jgi:putative hemolysin
VGEILLYTAGLLVLLSLSAFFSGSEAALFSLSRSQLRRLRQQPGGGQLAARLLDDPRSLLVTILLGNLTVNILATSTATALALRAFGERGIGIAFAVMSVVIIVSTEILPKAFGLHWSDRVAPVLAWPLSVAHALLAPVRLPLARFSGWVIDAVRARLGSSHRSYSWDELLTAVRIGHREGMLGQFEYEILSHVLEFREKFVREVMTPSIHVVLAPATATRDELLALFSSSGRSRIPVYGDSPDDILGILHVKDLVDVRSAGTEADLRGRLHEAFFIQETLPIVELYQALQKRRAHVALVLDEHGSFAGVVTIEDILEQVVGEIRDVRDARTQLYQLIDPSQIVVSGALELEDFNEVFETNLQDDDHETVAGYVLGITGRIPREGETIVADGVRFQILSASPNRIRKMRVEKL